MKNALAVTTIFIFSLISAAVFATDIKMVGIYITPLDPCAMLTQTTQARGVIKSVDGPTPLIYISYGINDAVKSHYKMENIPADTDINIDFQIPYPPAPNYQVWFKVEAQDPSNDTNPNNNYAEKSVHIEGCPPGKPDLKPVSISFEPAAFGKNYNIKIKYKIQNYLGSFGPSVPSEAQIKVLDQVIATCQVPALQLGEEYECQSDWKVADCNGKMILFVDSSNTNDELNEYGYNQKNVKIVCKVNEWMRDSLEKVPVKK